MWWPNTTLAALFSGVPHHARQPWGSHHYSVVGYQLDSVSCLGITCTWSFIHHVKLCFIRACFLICWHYNSKNVLLNQSFSFVKTPDYSQRLQCRMRWIKMVVMKQGMNLNLIHSTIWYMATWAVVVITVTKSFCCTIQAPASGQARLCLRAYWSLGPGSWFFKALALKSQAKALAFRSSWASRLLIKRLKIRRTNLLNHTAMLRLKPTYQAHQICWIYTPDAEGAPHSHDEAARPP